MHVIYAAIQGIAPHLNSPGHFKNIGRAISATGSMFSVVPTLDLVARRLPASVVNTCNHAKKKERPRKRERDR